MSRFVLTAQLQLQAPTNTAQVVRQIQSQLNNVQVNVQVQGTAQATRQVQQVAQSLNAANSAASNLGRTFAISVKRFTALAVATRAVSLFTNTLANATQEAIDFERILIKVSQVTGQTIGELRFLTKSITDLSTGLGVSSKDLLNTSQLLLQAGVSARDTEVALKTLAKAALAPNFDSLSETTEGAIAILAQFQEGVGSLEGQLSSINAVAGAFAVEAGDLIDVIRRTGGVFKASGGSLNELIALFTSVRATTRESAESIGTGLRTIFTRIQRPKTIEFLKQFGVELVDLEGKFVGPFEAVRRLSEALTGLGERDITFIRIAEELGGFRQIGKVLPLLQQFKTSQDALNVAQKAGNGLTKDAETAQQALAVRITKVQEEFLALVRSITETSSFQIFANTTLNLASALIRLADALKPIIPLLTAVATIKLASGLSTFIGGFGRGITSGRTFNKGGKVLGFARGGMVPGSGNRDTVPAMLQPGEFVIRKSSVGKLGAGNLAAMNENRYADGGKINIKPGAIGGFFLQPEKGTDRPYKVNDTLQITGTNALSKLGLLDSKDPSTRQAILEAATKAEQENILYGPKTSKRLQLNKKISSAKSPNNPSKNVLKTDGTFANGTGLSADAKADDRLTKRIDKGSIKLSKDSKLAKSVPITGNISSYFPGADDLTKNSEISSIISNTVSQGLEQAVLSSAPQIASKFQNTAIKISQAGFNNAAQRIANDPNAKKTTEGFIFEGAIQAITGAQLSGSQANFDFGADSIRTNRNSLAAMFTNSSGEGIDALMKADAKRSNTPEALNSIVNKIGNEINRGNLLGVELQKFAGGGEVLQSKLSTIRTLLGEFYGNDEALISKSISNSMVYDEARADKIIGNLQSSRSQIPLFKKLLSEKSSSVGVLNGFPIARYDAIGGVETMRFDELKDEQTIKEFAKRGKLAIQASRGTVGKRIIYSDQKSARRRFASGGGVGTDTVPALLTPGEFVINKKSAQAIGYGSLNRMNKVGKYAKGGVVQKFAAGGQTQGNTGNLFSGFGSQLTLVTASLQALIPPIDENSSAISKVTNNFLSLATTVGAAIFALEAFGITINKEIIGKAFKSLTTTGKGGLGDIIGGFQKQGGKTVRTKGESIRESIFNVRKSANIDRQITAAREQSFQRFGPNTRGQPLFAKQRFDQAQKIKRLRAASKAIPDPTSLTGKVGSFLGKKSLSGGIGGRIAGLAARGISSVSGLGGGAIGGLAGGAAALSGPALAITGVIAAINSVVGSYRDLDSKLQESIKAQNVAKSQQLAISKAASESIPLIGNFVSGISDALGIGSDWIVSFATIFGGDSVAQIKSGIAVQIQADKAQKALTKATEDSAKAMQDFQNGTKSAIDVLRTTTGASKEAVGLKKATDQKIAANEANKTGIAGSIGREIGAYLTFGYVDTGIDRNKRIDKENEALKEQGKKAEEEALKVATPGLQVLQRQVAATGGSFEDFLNIVKNTDPDLFNIIMRQGSKDLNDSFINLAKEAERTRKAFDAMDLGFQKVSAVSASLSVGLENYLSSQEAGYSALDNTIRTLEASVTNAAQGISDANFSASLGNARDGLEKLGASEKQITKFEENLTAINTAQKFYAKASEEVKNKLIADFQAGRGADLSAVGKKEKFADVISSQLGAAGIGDKVKKRISDAIQGANIEETDLNKILEGDLSVLDKVLKDLGETTLNQVIGPLKELAKYEQTLANLTKKRIELENNLINAQRGVLQANLEAQEIIAKYGGPALTSQIRTQNAIAQANIQAQGTGVGALRTGSAAELNARSAQIRAGLAGIGNIRTQAASGNVAAQQQLAGRSGVALEAQEKRLLELAKSDYDTTKLLIQNKEQELKLIEEKNKLEKDSIDALVSGDIDKFFEQQAAVGAQAAIALGSERLQGAFGASALGAAAQDIRRQQEAGQQTLFGQQLAGAGGLTERAFGAAIGARGITDPRLAQIAAGTTAEESNIQSQIRDLAATLPNYAQTQLDSSQIELQAANNQILAAEKQLEAARANVEQRSGGVGVAAMASGGLIYANRGIFVPRGTDTVPAMLTPGEFVVRREAVQRGNNLQMLQAMNRGSSGGQSSIGAAVGMANGGVVNQTQYLAFGGFAKAMSGLLDGDFIGKLSQTFNSFMSEMSKNIDKLNSTNFNVKLDTTNINVNLTGGTFLSQMTDQVKTAVMQEVAKEIQNYSAGEGGKLRKNNGIVGNR